MDIDIPGWVIITMIPWFVMYVATIPLDGHDGNGGGYFPTPSTRSSTRIFFSLCVCLPLSLLIFGIYWMGKYKGWF